MRRPIKFNPVRSSVDYTWGQAEGHHRRLNRNIVSQNREDNREPLRNAEVDAAARTRTWDDLVTAAYSNPARPNSEALYQLSYGGSTR